MEIENLIDLKNVTNLIKQDNLQDGMYFLMRDNIFPNWEDPDNREGGCWSYKVSSNSVKSIWDNLLLKCIYETILDENPEKGKEENIKYNMEEINGISISPKKEFNIIKIWNRNNDNIDLKLEDTNSIIGDENIIYKRHIIEE